MGERGSAAGLHRAVDGAVRLLGEVEVASRHARPMSTLRVRYCFT